MQRQTMILPVMALLALLFAAAPWGSAVAADEKWGPFRGRIIDIDTGQPIAGAVAIAVWLQNIPTPVHGNLDYHDARVAVTDANGEFEIPRLPPPFFSARIEMPRFDYSAPGYVLWNPEAVWRRPGVAHMRKLATLRHEEQFRVRGTGQAGMIPLEKETELLAAVNAERRRMGLRPMRDLEGRQ